MWCHLLLDKLNVIESTRIHSKMIVEEWILQLDDTNLKQVNQNDDKSKIAIN